MDSMLRIVGPQDAGEGISADEFATAECVPPYRYERVKGRLVVLEPASADHRDTARAFRRILSGYWEENQDVLDYVDTRGWVAMSADDDRLPDICVYLKSSSDGTRVPHRVPDIVLEMTVDSRAEQERNYIHKRAEYRRIGVKEYVIVDRFKRKVLALTWADDNCEEAWLTAGAMYTSPLLPGLEIPLAEAIGMNLAGAPR